MDYELLMDSKWTQKSLAMYVKEVIERKLMIDYIEDSDYIVISCEYFRSEERRVGKECRL